MQVQSKKKINVKSLIINLAIPIGVGLIAGLISMGGMDRYQTLNKSELSPPGYIFPIVWTVLYILMGISAYIISESRLSVKRQEKYRDKSLTTYAVQLGINFFWPIIFFNSQNYLFALFWLILLLAVVFYMTWQFWQIEQSAAYLQVPYILWLIFAGYLNLTVFLMNR